MAAKSRTSKNTQTGRHRKSRRDTDRVVRWLQTGAVMTGIGAAVISGQGVAWAQTDADNNTNASDNAAPSGGENTNDPGAANTGEPDTSPPSAAANDPDGDDDTDADAVDLTDAMPPDVTVDDEDETGDDEQDIDTDANLDDSEPLDRGNDSTDGDGQQQNNNRHTLSDTQAPSTLRSTESQTPITTTESSDSGSQKLTLRTATTFAETTASAVILRPPTATVAVTDVTPRQTPAFHPIRQIVVGVLGLFGLNPNPAPGSPTPNPLLEAVWALYRRVESTFDNDTPTVTAASVNTLELTDEGDVIVTGAVDFDDANNDPLTYTSTNGAHGTVTVDEDGKYTYTLTDPSYIGTDTFKVTASDAGPHLHGLFGIFGGGHARTATIKITIADPGNVAPVINDVDSEPGINNTWTVTVDATDADGDDITYGLTAADPTKVTITPVAGQSNQFTVEVTDSAWALANPGKQLLVTATATDGASNPDTDTRAIGTVNNAIAVVTDDRYGLDEIPALPAGVTYTQVSAGDWHTLLLRSDGQVVAVGEDGSWKDIPVPPEGLTYTGVAAGTVHSVLLRSDGSVVAFGEDYYGETEIPDLPAGVTYTQVAAGDGHTVLLRSDGQVEAFGNNDFGQTDIPDLPAGVTYISVDADQYHTLLLRSDGQAVSASDNFWGQDNIPDLPEGMTYLAASGGAAHTVLLRSDGTVVTVGKNVDGQRNIPPLPDGLVYTQAVASGDSTVLVRSDGALFSVGQTEFSSDPRAYGVAYSDVAVGIGRKHSVLLSAVNAAPVGTNDALNAAEDTPKTITPNSLLGNDTDPNGSPLTVTAVWGAEHGTTSLAADGTITYTPDADYTGTDTFSYLAYDGSLGDTATVTVTVGPNVNDAPVIDTVVSDPGTGNEWIVDVATHDPDGDPVTVTITPVDTGHVTVTGTGTDVDPFKVTITDTDWAKANPGKQILITTAATDGTADAESVTKAIGTVNNAAAFGSNVFGQSDMPALPAGVTYIQVAVGGDHTVLLRSDGTVVAVGNNARGQTNVPTLPPGVTYTQVAANSAHTVLLRSDGNVEAFGNNTSGENNVPTLPAGVTYTAVAAGEKHTVLLRSDGEVEAFGNNSNGQTTVPTLPAGVKYTAVAADGFHTVLLRSDGKVEAFGINSYGQTNVPTLPPAVTYTGVAAGFRHTVLLRSDGKVEAFGDAATADLDVPPLPAGLVYTKVLAGGSSTMLFRSDGAVNETLPAIPPGVTYTGAGFGSDHAVVLSGLPSAAPIAGNDAVAVSDDAPSAIAPNTLLGNDSDPDGDALTVKAVWGATKGTTALGADGTITYTPNAGAAGIDTFSYLAYDGALGTATTVTVTLVEIADPPAIDDVASNPGAGNTWKLDITTDDPDGDALTVTVAAADAGHVTVGGTGTDADPFTVTVTDAEWAKANPGKQLVVTVTASDGTTDPVTETLAIGTVNNVLGVGTVGRQPFVPPALPAGVTYTQVAAGWTHAILLRSDGTAVGVGDNANGKIDIPDLPPGLTYTEAAVGIDHTVLLRSDGTVVAFGSSAGGRTTIPVLPPGLTYVKVAAGGDHTVLLLSDGTVKAVGNNVNGQLNIPAPPAGKKYTQIGAGWDHTALLLDDGTAVAVGSNQFGQGNIPPLPAGLTYTQLSVGPLHTVLLRSDGQAFAFGLNNFGQTNVVAPPPGLTYTQVAAGSAHTVLLLSDGTVKTVGTDQGQTTVPALPAGVTYAQISAGEGVTILFIAVDSSADL